MRWLRRAMTRCELRRRACLLNAHMYEDVEALGLGPYQYALYDLGSSRLRMNLIRAVTDTYVAQISRSTPKPRALTSGGDWTLKRRAQGLTRWFEGKAEDIHLYRDVSGPMCLDSAVFQVGIAKVFRLWPNKPELQDVGVERTFPWELVCDDAEAQNPNNLRNLAQVKWYDRTVLSEMFPDQRGAIAKASPHGPILSSFDLAVHTVSDLVAVSELWHLPSYLGASDGRHVICIEGATLYDDAWDRQRFPFAFCYRGRPTMGIWGVSIPHELRGRQTHINTSLADIEDCLRLYGKPKIVSPVGSVPKDAFDDDIDSIIEFSGQVPPTLWSPAVMPPEQYQFIRDQWTGGFEQIGLNPQTSASQVPQGLSGSGASIRAWDDLQNGRLYRASANYEDAHMQIADLMIDEARAIAKDRPDFASAYRGKTYVEIVRFRDVDPGRDKFFLKVWPESRLSKAPAQRLAQLTELLNGKVISNEEFRELLDFPDLESEDNLQNSPRELTEKLVTRILDAADPDAPGILIYPEPEWPLDTPDGKGMRIRVQFAVLRAQLDGAPEANLRVLRQWLSLADAIIDRAKAAMAPPPGGPPGAPGAPANINGAPAAPITPPPAQAAA